MKTNVTLEQALAKASKRLQEKMMYSIDLLKKAERLALAYGGGNGYYLAFSGGKDSQALYHIAELAGVKFDAHMNFTSVDPPEVIRFVKKQYPDVDFIKPKKSIYQLAVEKQILPTMRVRWCCAEYKENSGAGRVTLIGIRHQEGSRRAKRNEVEISNRKYSGTLEGLDEYRNELKAKRARRKSKKDGVNITNADQEQTLGCISGKESLLISPIIHWTEQDVWEFLNKVMEVPHCSLYDEGWHRIGCIGCPMSSVNQKKIENICYPHVKRNWIKAIKAIRRGGELDSTEQEELSGVRPQGELSTADGCKQPKIGSNIQRIQGRADPRFRIPRQWMQYSENWVWLQDKNQLRSVERSGFSQSSSSDRLTDEQKEDLIAENIYDWWISGKSYKEWYADKFLQTKLEFPEEE